MKRRKHTREFTIWNVMTIICFSFFAFFFLYPLLRMIIGGIYVDGKFNFDSYKKFFTSRYYMSAVANSFKILHIHCYGYELCHDHEACKDQGQEAH